MTAPVELDERITAGLRVRLMYWAGDEGLADPVTLIEVYEGLDADLPILTYQTPGECAREAFLHPFGYAPTDRRTP